MSEFNRREMLIVFSFVHGISQGDLYSFFPNNIEEIDQTLDGIISKMESPDISEFKNQMSKVTELIPLIQSAVKDQHYEKAAELRDKLLKIGKDNKIKLWESSKEITGKSMYESTAKEELLKMLANEFGVFVDEITEFSQLSFYISPGTATKEEIAELFVEISTLFRMIGGSGISFKQQDVNYKKLVC